MFLKAKETSRVLIVCSSQKIFTKFVSFLIGLRRQDFNINEFVIFHVNLFSDDLQPEEEFLQDLRNQSEVPTLFKITVANPRLPPVQLCQVRPHQQDNDQ